MLLILLRNFVFNFLFYSLCSPPRECATALAIIGFAVILLH